MTAPGWRHSLSWALRTALRDGRGARGRALLYALSMALGIGALVAMGSLETDLTGAVASQTRSLVGADLVIWAREPFDQETQKFLDTIPGKRAKYDDFASMARFPDSGDASHLARLRALEGDYPFYGELQTEPVEAASSFRDGPFVLVARSLMERTGARPGDPVVIGAMRFTIAGALERTPGETLAAASLGPRIYMPYRYLAATGLIRPGSRVFHSVAFHVPADFDPDAFAERHEQFLNSHRLSWDTVAKRRDSLGEALAHLGDYLNLTACLALLLGGLGVAGAVHYHIQRKTRQIATLRCLGATLGQVAAVFLIQVSLMAGIAILVGGLLGVGIQFLLPQLVKGLLPIQFSPSIHPLAILTAAAWGWLMSVLLASIPLLRVRHISPLACFRPDLEQAPRRWERWLVPLAAALAWWLFACLRANSWLKGSLFAGGLLLCFALLLISARLLARLARALPTRRWPFPWRHGLANLFRPHNQTSAFMIILGMGVFLITVLSGMRAMLLSSFDSALTKGRPDFMAFDIQADQVEAVRARVEALNFEVRDLVPVVPMRLAKLKGKDVTSFAGELPDWVIQREYRSTFRDQLTETEKLTEGRWVGRVTAETSPIPISIEDDIAKTLKLGLGDHLTMDVLGVELELEVASLRKVDWQSMQPNFFIVFPAGVLEAAPQMYLLTTLTGDERAAGRLQQALVTEWPNVSCMDMREVVQTIDEILERAASAVHFLAALCIGAGLLLLGSAIWNSRSERLGEWALLRTLGASRRTMALTTLVEYFLLGLFASLTGLLLAVATQWALAHFLFELPPFPRPATLLVGVTSLPLLTLLLGWLGLRDIWSHSPRTILRREE